MRTRRVIVGSLLLIVATMFNAVFAQSAEEAAKYGQLKEVSVPAAGKLGNLSRKPIQMYQLSKFPENWTLRTLHYCLLYLILHIWI